MASGGGGQIMLGFVFCIVTCTLLWYKYSYHGPLRKHSFIEEITLSLFLLHSYNTYKKKLMLEA